MTEKETIITTNPDMRVTRTELVPLLAVPERTSERIEPEHRTTFKDATPDDIDKFVQQQDYLDQEEKQKLSERLLKIQQKLQQGTEPDLGTGI